MTSTPLAGSRIKAANTPDPYILSAPATSSTAISGTPATDLTGATITFTTAQPNASVLVTGVFDAQTTATGAVGVGTCVVDGATQSGQATWGLTTLNARGTVTQVWNVTLATAGSHTIKLQGALSSASGTVTYGTTHTNINLLVMDW